MIEEYNQPKLLPIRRFLDSRGSLTKPWDSSADQTKFEIQDLYISHTVQGAFRGLHLQLGKWAQSKLVAVLDGAVLDFVVDLRSDSMTYGHITSFELDATSDFALLVPKGFAHGFYSKTDSIVLNLSDNAYSPDFESGVNPLSFEQIRGLGAIIISAKDEALPMFGQKR